MDSSRFFTAEWARLNFAGSQFKSQTYSTVTFRLQMLDAASKDDLLGAEDVVKSSGISGLFAGKPHVSSSIGTNAS